MRKYVKLLAVVLCVCMVAFAAVSCAGNGNSGSDKDSKVYNVGICQLLQHEALDKATEGFKAALTDKLGDKVKFDYQNAQGDSPTCSTICTGFASNNYDLIMANATPALQAAVSATSSIPIVGTSVTDYATALDYDSWNGKTGINVTGTCDLAPLDQQEDMILEVVPGVKKVAILYCSAEANSTYQSEQIQKYLDEDNVAYQVYTFSDSNDIQSVVTSAAAECDCVYIPTDNTAASNMTIVANVCQDAKIPIICGEENMTKVGGLSTLSISYYDIGYSAGEMAYEILVNGVKPGEMDIKTADAAVKKYNPDYAASLDMKMPEDYVAIDMGA